MFHVVLVPLVILAVIVCCCVPLPVVASVAASGLLWWLFVTYRNTLGAMSGIELGRSGLLEGYGTLAPRIGLTGADLTDSYGGAGLGGAVAGSSGPLTGASPSGRFSGAAPSGPSSGAAPSRQFSGAASSPRGAAESPRNSSRSGGFDEPFSPVSSPSVSILSRSSYKENLSYRSDDRSGGSPMLPPGSYPWLMPSAGPALKKRINLELVPVKIKVSKPTSSFLPNPDAAEEEPQKIDSSKQIIQALRAMSRKRLHTTESDDSHEESFGAVPKRRPMDNHHNLYASHLGSSDSSFQGIPEILEDGVVDSRTANGSEPNLNASSSASSGSVPNNGGINNAVPVSNKRPRAPNDGGSQAAKKINRTNNEILSSLSSSLALLDQNIINRRTMKRREGTTNVPAKKTKTLETHCVEVQTLPSPIMKEHQTKSKEDKSTGTDRIVEESKTSSHSTQNSGITEKKVTDKMAAALLKSALLKFANSGELVTPDTSANSNSILSECSLSKSEVAEKGLGETQKSVRFTLPGEAPKTTESVLINGTSSIPSLTSGTKVVEVEQPSKLPPAFTFGSGSLQSTSASAVTSSPALVTASVAPVASPSVSSAATSNADKPPGFTLASANSMSITPSPTENSSLFSFGSSAATPKSDPAANTASKTVEPPVSAPSTGFTFGAQSASEKPSFTFGAPSTPTSTPAPVPTSQKETTPAPVTSASTENKQSPFSFGQSITAAPSKVQQSSIGSGFKLGGSKMQSAVTSPNSAQPPASKPGGFSFTPSAKFSFGSSTTAATSSVATPAVTPASTAASSAATTLTQPAQPAFSFGNSAFGAKPPESDSKSLFGMPPPLLSKIASSAAEPPKLFGASGGFSFNPSSKDQQPGFSAQAPQKPEEKKQEGFVFGGFGQKPEAPKPFAVAGSAGTGVQSKSSAPAFAFGASSAPQPTFAASGATQTAFGSFSSKPADPPAGSVFNPPATTSSSLFGSTTFSAAGSGRNSVVSFGSTAPKTTLSFGAAATTVPSFGSATMTATTSANAAPSFSAGLTSMASAAPAFGSSAPAFGSSAPAFGSSAMTFGSGAAGFGSSNPPTFGSVAGAPSAPTTNTPAPTFGSGATSAPQFGSSSFGSSSVPTFGSTFGAGAAFGAPQTTTQQAAPAFGAPQTTTQQAAPAFGAPQTTTQQAAPAFGAPQTTTQTSAPAFGRQQTTVQSSPFSFSASAQPAAPASGGFNFQAPQASGPLKPMFQFGAAGAPTQPSAPQPFGFSGAPTPAPGIGGGFANTMFSIGSGTAAPRSRTTLRTRKK